MRRVIFNKKGGVGKSTITCNLAAMSAIEGNRTLVIDLDPQSNATQYLVGDFANEIEPTMADFFDEMLHFRLRRNPPESFIHATPFNQLFVMPAHQKLTELRSKLESKYKMFKLKEALDSLDMFDNIFIDTPPALNFFTRSALIAADTCLIPFDCDDFSRRALYDLIDNVKEIQLDHNSKLEVEGIVVNQFQQRANLPQRIVKEMIEEGLPVFNTYLSSSVKIKESHEKAMPIAYFEPNHKLALEFQALYKDLRI